MEYITKVGLIAIFIVILLGGSLIYVVETDRAKRDANINEVVTQLKSNGINVYNGTVESFVRIELSRTAFVDNVLTNQFDVIKGRIAIYYLDENTPTIAYYYYGS